MFGETVVFRCELAGTTQTGNTQLCLVDHSALGNCEQSPQPLLAIGVCMCVYKITLPV